MIERTDPQDPAGSAAQQRTPSGRIAGPFSGVSKWRALMTVIDYLILGIIAFSAVAGLIRGFLREVCSLVAVILAFWLAWHFASILEPYLGGKLADPPASTWAARAIIFIVVLMVGAALGALLTHLARVSMFSGLNRLLGFLLGVLRGLVLLGVVAMISHSLRLDEEGWWKKSRLIPYVESVANMLRSVAGERLVARGSVVDL